MHTWAGVRGESPWSSLRSDPIQPYSTYFAEAGTEIYQDAVGNTRTSLCCLPLDFSMSQPHRKRPLTPSKVELWPLGERLQQLHLKA